MDSWSLEEKMGVVKGGCSPGFNQSYQATSTGLQWSMTMCWVGLVQQLKTVYVNSPAF